MFKRWDDLDAIKLVVAMVRIKKGIQKFEGWRSLGINKPAEEIRDYWFNVYCPEVNRGEFTEEEDELIWKYYMEFGKNWDGISAKLNNARTPAMIKLRVSAIRKRKMQIDLFCGCPLLDKSLDKTEADPLVTRFLETGFSF